MLTKKTFLAAFAAGLMVFGAQGALANTEGVELMDAGNDIYSQPSLQRGARNFVNYCLGCHSAKYVRWNRVAADLGIPEGELKSLQFTGTAPFDTMPSGMPADAAKRWFGNAPPDMSLLARARGTDYIYTFLMTFYADDSRPHGVNNLALPGTTMPHVLSSLQGVQKAVMKSHMGEDGKPVSVVEKLEAGDAGTLKPEEYASFVRDTVNFIEYIGEPIQTKRRDLGVWVILFLLVFTGFAYLLKKEYWKDVK
jgi:ubiquinol-cytochrome c reductase cytochrome c1 subunit